ncbi:RNA polymerase sigma factor [Pontibacter actiniarum]|uniref:RNA polymerase subunit sigma-24 n=1 Tax=Pontibacter actiniarum TaxID=323450 RepID=A0A1X9YP63_9BACT|nr:sigma-70 family RNA polymerase sigma factor [Pontibacter actiniarum]ARS34670.1 hypothetical protein CA264_03970 [Pontibacter actiniarum]
MHNTDDLPLLQEKWLQLKGGDGDALKFLFDRYANDLYNYGTKFTQDTDLVKECVQEIFVTVWNRRGFLGEPVNVKNYLLKSYRRLLFKQLGTRQNYAVYSETAANYSFQVELSAEERLIAQERRSAARERLERALASLTARQREAVFLKFHENLSYEEIAEVMDISVKATYKLMAIALSELRDNLSQDHFMLLLVLALVMACSCYI